MSLSFDELELPEVNPIEPPPQTPQFPPSLLQCLHELQEVHALQFDEPVHLPAKAGDAEIKKIANNKIAVFFLKIILLNYKIFSKKNQLPISQEQPTPTKHPALVIPISIPPPIHSDLKKLLAEKDR